MSTPFAELYVVYEDDPFPLLVCFLTACTAAIVIGVYFLARQRRTGRARSRGDQE